MRRSRWLKYSSFLMMPVSIVQAAFGLMMINVFATARSFGGVVPAQMRLAGLALLVVLGNALCELVSGFVGALNWEEPLRARRCVLWGGVTLALGLLGLAVQALAGYTLSYVEWLTGVAVPANFLAAALRFYRACRNK